MTTIHTYTITYQSCNCYYCHHCVDCSAGVKCWLTSVAPPPPPPPSPQVDLMVHPLHTISYVADIESVLVVMAHKTPPPPAQPASRPGSTPTSPSELPSVKMTCHVLDTPDVRTTSWLDCAEKLKFALFCSFCDALSNGITFRRNRVFPVSIFPHSL